MSATTTAPPQAATAEAAPAGKKSGWFWKAVILGLILAVIGAECLFAFVYVTMATDKSTHPDAAAPAKPPKHEAAPSESHEKEHGKAGEHGEAGAVGEEQEADMGEYSLTAFQPAA
ncbi:MAG TPA: hypothetical protein VG125_16985, partial [Pirellulales bacterium]|nr:hypothetical protein [Pirellulales bacterium]